MSKSLSFLILFFFSLFLLSASARKEIPIGFIADLSGRGSEIWIHSRNGLMLGIEEYNLSDPVITLRLEVRDDKGDDELSKTYMDELIAQGVTLFMGPTTSGSAINLQDYFNRQDLLFISSTVSTDELSGLKDSLIRTTGTAHNQGAQLARIALEKEGDRRFVIVVDSSNSSYTSLVSQGFLQEIEEVGARSLQTYSYMGCCDQTFYEMASSINILNPDGLLIVGNDLDSAALIQQVFKINPTIHFYTPSWANTQDFIINAGKAAEGSYQIGNFDYNSQHPDYLSFRESYREKFGFDPLFTGARSYEAISILTNQLKDMKRWDIIDIKNGFIDEEIFYSFLGDFSMDPYGDVDRDYIYLQIKDGKGVIIYE